MDGAVVPTHDILNVGKDHKYMANSKLVHNSDKINLQNLSKRIKEPVLRQSLCVVHNHAWVAADSLVQNSMKNILTHPTNG